MYNHWHQILIFSGRSGVVIDETVDWLQRHDVHFSSLRMRPEGDYRPDEQLKREWLAEIDRDSVLFVLDDRQKVVDMWRDEGLPCFQVAPGAF